MKITIITVGKIKENYLKDAICEYSKRLSRYCKLNIIELADEKTPDNASQREEELIKEKEGQRIMAQIKSDSYVIALSLNEKEFDSPTFSNKIQQLGVNGVNHITFIIGGSIGIAKNVLDYSNECVSFSKLTFPHQLMRVILLEQLYRSFKIATNEPYHK